MEAGGIRVYNGRRMTLQQQLESGMSHHQAGRLVEAASIYRQVLAQNPKHAEALNLLGVLAGQAGRFNAAAEFIRRATELDPEYADAHCNLGNAFLGMGRFDEAIVAYRNAARLKPDFAVAHNNLGEALKDNGQHDEAIASYRQAIRLDPAFANAHCNLGVALQRKGRLDEAIACHRQAIALKPDLANAHLNLALALLTGGDFHQGLAEYEWRRKIRLTWTAPVYSQPEWMGEELEERTILLFQEQGFGDAIQFVRYVSLVARRGGRVIIACLQELARLFEQLPDVAKVVVAGQLAPPFDIHCPLMSLPRLFKTDLYSIPAKIPYLRADPALVKKWNQKLGPKDARIRIGLAWGGNSTHPQLRRRSVQPQEFLPLVRLNNAVFYSLQKGPAHTPLSELRLIDFTSELSDFASTAALIENLDLVVTVDTAVAHLSGAVGKPTWVLLPFVSDWRWLIDREDSPWYPTMRLFRQQAMGDWAGVVKNVVEELRKSFAGS
jgi:tetratricopeptide (TPR) repeat protein